MARLSQLFHLTASKNARRIRREGLRADDEGWIYLFTDMIVANTIARDQVFIRDRYAVFRVNRSGLAKRLQPDRVAEFARTFQKRVRQERIDPKHLTMVGHFAIVAGQPTEWDYYVGEVHGGKTPTEVDLEFRVLRALQDGTLKTPRGGITLEEGARQLARLEAKKARQRR